MMRTHARRALFCALLMALLSMLLNRPTQAAPDSPAASPSATTAETPAAGDNAKLSNAAGALAKVQTLLEFYYMETGVYPDTIEEMLAQYNQGVKNSDEPVRVPTDPATGRKLVYVPNTERTSYVVRVPDPSQYGVASLEVKSLDWGWMNGLAAEQKKRRLIARCASLQDGIAAALNQYNKDNHNKYPDSLQELVPKYMKTLPNCPAAKKPYKYSHDARGFEVICPEPSAHGLETFMFSSTEGPKKYP
jgi:hypothetical protein